jgi:hypothetical protein
MQMDALARLVLVCGAALAMPAAALSPSEYGAARQHADAQYRIALQKCRSLDGNARDVCVKDARAARDSARADAYAALRGKPEARADAVEDKAEARYRAARERCEPLVRDERSACIKRAQAERARAKTAAGELRAPTSARGTGAEGRVKARD